MIDPMKIVKYSDKILEIIEHKDHFSNGDLQGAIEAVVVTIITETESSKK
jgi:hypothetical protein